MVGVRPVATPPGLTESSAGPVGGLRVHDGLTPRYRSYARESRGPAKDQSARVARLFSSSPGTRTRRARRARSSAPRSPLSRGGACRVSSTARPSVPCKERRRRPGAELGLCFVQGLVLGGQRRLLVRRLAARLREPEGVEGQLRPARGGAEARGKEYMANGPYMRHLTVVRA